MRLVRLLVVFVAVALVASILGAVPVVAQQGQSPECTGIRDGQTVTLSFDGTVGSSVQLLVNGRWQQTVTGLTTVTDESPVGTTYDLRVRNAGTSFDERCDVTEDVAVDNNGQATCTVVAGDPNILEFSGDLGDSVQLRKNGSWVATVTGRANFILLPGEGTDGYVIRVRGGRFGGDIACSTDPQPPAADAAICSLTRDGSEVTLSFDGTLSSSVQLRRDGRWLATVTGETTFTDTSVVGTLYVLRVNDGNSRTDYPCVDGGAVGDPGDDGGALGVTGAPVCTVSADGATLTFSGDLGDSVQLRRDGRWVATVTGESTFPADGPDGYTIRVRGGTQPGDVACAAGTAVPVDDALDGEGTLSLNIDGPAGQALIEIRDADDELVEVVVVNTPGAVEVVLPAGQYSLVPRQVTSNGVRFDGTADQPTVLVGGDEEVDIAISYQQSAGVQDLFVSNVSPTTLSLEWSITDAAGLTVVRTDGDDPAASPAQGTPIPTPLGNTLTDTNLVPGQTYTYTFFADAGEPVSIIASPEDVGAAVPFFAFTPDAQVLEEDEFTPYDNGETLVIDLGADGDIVLPGTILVLPRTAELPGGYPGRVISVDPTGQFVELEQAPMFDIFDLYILDVPDIAALPPAEFLPENSTLSAVPGGVADGFIAAEADLPDCTAFVFDEAGVEFSDLGVEFVPDGFASMSIDKREVRLLPDVPTALVYDVEVSLTADIEFDAEISAEGGCGIDYDGLFIPVPGPIPLAVNFEFFGEIEYSGAVALDNVGGVAVGGFRSSGRIPIVGSPELSSSEISSFTPNTPSFNSAEGGLGVEISTSGTFGPGAGTNVAGLIGGLNSRIDFIDASANVIVANNPGGLDVCVRIEASASASVNLAVRAFTPLFDLRASVQLVEFGPFEFFEPIFIPNDDCTQEVEPEPDPIPDPPAPDPDPPAPDPDPPAPDPDPPAPDPIPVVLPLCVYHEAVLDSGPSLFLTLDGIDLDSSSNQLEANVEIITPDRISSSSIRSRFSDDTPLAAGESFEASTTGTGIPFAASVPGTSASRSAIQTNSTTIELYFQVSGFYGDASAFRVVSTGQGDGGGITVSGSVPDDFNEERPDASFEIELVDATGAVSIIEAVLPLQGDSSFNSGWRHLAITHDQIDAGAGQTIGLANVYLDGQVIGSTSTSGSLGYDALAPLALAAGGVDHDEFSGRIVLNVDELAVYNRALSSTEINTHIDATTGACDGAGPTVLPVCVYHEAVLDSEPTLFLTLDGTDVDSSNKRLDADISLFPGRAGTDTASSTYSEDSPLGAGQSLSNFAQFAQTGPNISIPRTGRADSPIQSNQTTIELFFRLVDAFEDTTYELVSTRQGVGGGITASVRHEAGADNAILEVEFAGAAGTANTIETVIPLDFNADSGWQHLAITHNQSGPTRGSGVVFLDGVFVDSATTTGVLGYDDTAPVVLEAVGLSSDFGEIRVDELAVYDRTLSAFEILSHFEAADGTCGQNA